MRQDDSTVRDKFRPVTTSVKGLGFSSATGGFVYILIDGKKYHADDVAAALSPADGDTGAEARGDQAFNHLANVLFADPGPKANAAVKAAREWWQSEDRKDRPALTPTDTGEQRK